jgi:mannosyltransferase OCH1-like enzyme
MIPKIIHYCWFGRNPLPQSALKCIESWKMYLPEYEIKEWNEDNFDVNIIPYTREAYDAKKYAFVSDYARYWILYHYGGLYFDTDVEVIKPLADIVDRGAFMGIETPAIDGVIVPRINPGLGIATEAGTLLYKELLSYYDALHFLDDDGKPNEITIVEHTTKVLASHGMQPHNTIQQVAGIWIYPVDYFNPLDDNTGRLKKTSNTHSVHWYSKTWMDKTQVRRNKITRIIHRWFGVNSLQWLKKMISKFE